MPATSEKQAHAMQMALAIRKGAKIKAKSSAIREIAKSMTASKIKEFTHT